MSEPRAVIRTEPVHTFCNSRTQEENQEMVGEKYGLQDFKEDCEYDASDSRASSDIIELSSDDNSEFQPAINVEFLPDKKSKNMETPEQPDSIKGKALSTSQFSRERSKLSNVVKKSVHCTKCSKLFIVPGNQIQYKVDLNGKNSYTCSTCDTSTSQESFERSESRQSLLIPWLPIVEEQISHRCTTCGKTFMSQLDLDRHRQMHTQYRHSSCAFCGKLFFDTDILVNHILSHRGESPHVCGTCGKSFSDQGSLDSHVLAHRTEIECIFCGERFVSKFDLCAHMPTHSEERFHICLICGKVFATKDHLSQHESTHSEDESYECKHCHREFDKKFDLNTHLLEHSEQTRYRCKTCGKVFSMKGQYKTHLLRHSKERLFICMECGESFRRRIYLNSHMSDHSIYVFYSCEHCGKTFSDESSMDGHMEEHERNWGFPFIVV